jgi:hypothetical protein
MVAQNLRKSATSCLVMGLYPDEVIPLKGISTKYLVVE